ncbi:MAG: RsmB/NOP family class I SAM-dependent RNA methyltransferase [Clostridia bacterium]|nr:RsmB/NOP family class I SAM-dependent RNA methyltransferase [Clostridia bacterium]
MLPPIILTPKSDETILDMTAAPGGKTTELSALSNNEAMITACEKNKIRLERLKYNIEKQGARVTVIEQDARKLDEYFSFDKILLDAPCSGSGTENIYEEKFSKELIAKSVKTQEELLKKAVQILKPNGELTYSTCSILKQENEGIINKILKTGKVEIIKIDPPKRSRPIASNNRRNFMH